MGQWSAKRDGCRLELLPSLDIADVSSGEALPYRQVFNLLRIGDWERKPKSDKAARSPWANQLKKEMDYNGILLLLERYVENTYAPNESLIAQSQVS